MSRPVSTVLRRAERRVASTRSLLALRGHRRSAVTVGARLQRTEPTRASRQPPLARRPRKPAPAGQPRPSFPLQAERAQQRFGGLLLSGTALDHGARRGLQGRPTYPSDEGLS